MKRHQSYYDAMEHFNEPVLDGVEVVRLVGWGQDDMDCFFVYIGQRRGLYRSTAVCGFTPLRCLRDQSAVTSRAGEYWDDYTRIESLLSLNGVLKAPAFLLEDGCDANVTASA